MATLIEGFAKFAYPKGDERIDAAGVKLPHNVVVEVLKIQPNTCVVRWEKENHLVCKAFLTPLTVKEQEKLDKEMAAAAEGSTQNEGSSK